MQFAKTELEFWQKAKTSDLKACQTVQVARKATVWLLLILSLTCHLPGR